MQTEYKVAIKMTLNFLQSALKLPSPPFYFFPFVTFAARSMKVVPEIDKSIDIDTVIHKPLYPQNISEMCK